MCPAHIAWDEFRSCAITTTTAAAPCAAVTSGLFQGAQCCVFGYGALVEAPDSYPGLRVLKPGDRIALDRAAQVASLERVWAANNSEDDDQHALESTYQHSQAPHLSQV